jgi:type IX secretion system PorP/SprF family membrane protein
MNNKSLFMKTVRFATVVICTTCFGIPASYAQDPHISQFDKLPLLFNPAISGALYKIQVSTLYRSQWTSVEAPFKTLALSFDQRLSSSRNGFMGIGLSVLSDNTGNRLTSMMDLKLSFSGHIRLSKVSSIGIGLNGGFIQRSGNLSGMQWGSQYASGKYNADLVNAEGNWITSTVLSPDFGAGILYNYNMDEYKKVTGNNDVNFHGGFSVHHLNRPSMSYVGSDEKLPMRFTLFGNSMVRIANSNLATGPYFFIQKQSTASEIVIGNRFRYTVANASKYTGFKSASAVYLITGYRWLDAVILGAQYEFSSYSLGLSYDVNISKLTAYTNGRGAWEVFLKFAAANRNGGRSKFKF